MGKRILEISFEFMASMFQQGGPWPPPIMAKIVKGGLPADARIVDVRRVWPDTIELLIEAESWSHLVDEDGKIPRLSTTLQTCKSREPVTA